MPPLNQALAERFDVHAFITTSSFMLQTQGKNMKILSFTALAAVLVLSGCSTMTPARYSMSVDNNQALKHFDGSTFSLAELSAPSEYDANCRLMGPIRASDNQTITQFITKAFNDEFKFAEVYGDNGVKLSGRMDKIAFSSTAGLTGGWWDLALTINSANGQSMSVENKYDFKSGFDAITACNQTAQALGPAVQDLIKKTVTDPRFKTLLK